MAPVFKPNGGEATQTWQIIVTAPNAPPSIISTPVVQAIEAELYSYDVEAVDPNAGDTLTFSLDVAPADRVAQLPLNPRFECFVEQMDHGRTLHADRIGHIRTRTA